MKKRQITSPAIRLKVTGICNRSCSFCNKEGDMEGISSIRPDQELFECLNALFKTLNIQKVMITGGEPTLHPQLLEIISGIKAPEISITTNGTLLKASEEWRNLRRCGLTKVVVSINEVSPERFLIAESQKRNLNWALNSLQNQIKNLVNLYEAGLPTRVNTVAYGEIKSVKQVFEFLRTLQSTYQFEVRLLNDLTNVKQSQEVISYIIAELGAEPIHSYRRAGSSNVTQYYRTENGFEFSTKLSFSYFFEPICKSCIIRERKECFEGFYGPRVELRQGGYYIRLCLYQQTSNVLMPWEKFISSGLANELRKTFQEIYSHGKINMKEDK